MSGENPLSYVDRIIEEKYPTPIPRLGFNEFLEIEREIEEGVYPTDQQIEEAQNEIEATPEQLVLSISPQKYEQAVTDLVKSGGPFSFPCMRNYKRALFIRAVLGHHKSVYYYGDPSRDFNNGALNSVLDQAVRTEGTCIKIAVPSKEKFLRSPVCDFMLTSEKSGLGKMEIREASLNLKQHTAFIHGYAYLLASEEGAVFYNFLKLPRLSFATIGSPEHSEPIIEVFREFYDEGQEISWWHSQPHPAPEA